MQKNLRYFSTENDSIGESTVKHNLDAFKNDAVFGMSNRMSLLLYPVAAFLRWEAGARILIVGPRTEDDIFMAKALGIYDVTALDLFSYSNTEVDCW